VISELDREVMGERTYQWRNTRLNTPKAYAHENDTYQKSWQTCACIQGWWQRRHGQDERSAYVDAVSFTLAKLNRTTKQHILPEEN